MCNSKINRFSKISVLLAAVLLLGACGKQAIVTDETITPYTEPVVNYHLVTVENGVFSRSNTYNSASLYFQDMIPVYSTAKMGTLNKLYVNKYEYVEEGDLIATITVAENRSKLEEALLSLKRTKEAFETEKLAKKTEIEVLQEVTKEMQDGTQKEINKLTIEKLNSEYNQYLLVTNQAIDEIQVIVSEIELDSKTVEIYAPCEGYVSDTAYISAGDTIQKGDYLALIVSLENPLLMVEDTEHKLRYNMEVDCVGRKSKEITYKGRVVAASDVIPTENWNGYALIELLEFDQSNMDYDEKFSVTYSDIYVENVLCVDSDALTLEEGKYYVNLYEDGQVTKQIVSYGMKLSDKAWILDGLTKGQTVVQ